MELSFRITWLSVIIGCLQGKPDIAILNDITSIACGSMSLFTCTISTDSMFWYVNDVSIRECNETICVPTGVPLPDNYILTNTGNTFYLDINPVTYDDNSMVSCSDGQMSDTITITPRTEITNDTLTRNESVYDNKVTVTVTSNCVEMASGATFELTKQKSTEQDFVQDTELTPIKTTIPCTNDENPDCGGNQTSRVSIVTNIQQARIGDVYTYRLKVTYSESEAWITLGTYTVASTLIGGVLVNKKSEESVSSTDDDSSWCKDNLNDCVAAIVVPIGMLLMIIIAVVISLNKKGSKFMVQFKDLPVDFELIKDKFKSEGFDVSDRSEIEEGTLLSISANTGKYPPPTFEVDHFKFTSVQGKKPIDFIYSCTEIRNQNEKKKKKKKKAVK